MFTENLAHFVHGAALMFFLSLSIRIYPLRKENRMMRILFFSMVFMTFLEIKDMVYLVEGIWYDSYASRLCMSLDMVYVPLMAVFLFETLSPGWATPLRSVLMFAPQVAAGLLFAFTASESVFRFSMLFAVLYGLAVVVTVFLASSRHDNYIRNNFSYTEGISARWTRTASIALFISLFVWTFLLWEDSWLGDAGYYLVSMLTWAYIGYRSLKYRIIEVPQTICLAFAVKESTEVPQNVNGASFEKNLKECMEERQIFLNPKLTLQDVAQAVGTNRTYLSDYLNGTLHTTFYEYVNTYRVRYACSLLSAPDACKLSLTEVSERSGFNSMSTFNRAFVKVTGKTPTSYLKQSGRTF